MNFFDGRIESKDGRLIFTDGGISVTVPDAMRSKVEAYTGKAITFGIRPEDIFDPQFNDTPSERISARVEVKEPMGSETYLYLTTGQTPFIARVDPHTSAEIDEQREFGLHVGKCHFFDPQSELALT
jgi:multiple sugar transport system ATP-binding protein